MGTIVVGNYGSGTLSIANHGSVTGGGILGDYTGSSGLVTVDGPGSIWSNGCSCVGGNGSGTLSITGGGSVTGSFTSILIGANAGSHGLVKVDGAGSSWSNSGVFYVGCTGAGTLSIANHGIVTSGTSIYGCFLGHDPQATGLVTVDGPGTSWKNNTGLYVGYQGGGTLSVTDGGTVSVTGSNSGSRIATQRGSTGVVVVDGSGSTWLTGATLNVGQDGNGAHLDHSRRKRELH